MQFPPANQPPPPSKAPQSKLPHQKWWWWLVMLALLAWNVWLLWPARASYVSLPYSAFLDQVRADNVAQVEIAGDQITGQFRNATAWPPVTPGATTSATPPATPAPVTTYSAFR
ncbi:MAG: ATP-dependent metallopeptidase FtsH/Yme1/Tma family protein, partial [Anaerolineales bacterium]